MSCSMIVRVMAAAMTLYGILGAAPVVHPAGAEFDVRFTEILGTGDAVPGFGRIGSFGFGLLGLADDGSILVAVASSDGRTGLYWVNTTVRPVWVSGEAGAPMLRAWSARGSRSGYVVARVDEPSSTSFVIFQPSHSAETVNLQTDADGNTVCGLHPPSINAAGEVAVQADVAPTGHKCFEDAEGPYFTAIYLVSGGVRHRVVDNFSAADEERFDFIDLVGVDGAGRAVFRGGRAGAARGIFAAVPGTIEGLVVAGAPDDTGKPIGDPYVVAVGAVGELAFLAHDGRAEVLYRATEGKVVRVAAKGAVGPEGSVIDAFPGVLSFNELGDIAAPAYLKTRAADGTWRGRDAIVVYPTNGEPRVLFESGPNSRFGAQFAGPDYNVQINNHGAVAFPVYARGGAASYLALRWEHDTLVRLLSTGDSTPDGAIFAAGGLDGAKCLAADGAVATVAQTISGQFAYTCVDASGAHVVVQGGDFAPEGGVFDSFGWPCQFTDDGALLFAGYKMVMSSGQPTLEGGIYRARSDGLDRLAGPGERTVDGDTLTAVDVSFANNAAGAVVFRGSTGSRDGLFVSDAGGIRPLRTPELPIRALGRFGVTDAGDIIVLARVDGYPSYDYDPNALVLVSGAQARVVASLDSLPGVPLLSFEQLAVKGSLAVIGVEDAQGQSRLVAYRIGDTDLTPVLPTGWPWQAGDLFWPALVDFTAAGRILLSAYVWGDEPGYFSVDAGGSPQRLIDFTPRIDPFAINAAGTIAAMSYESPIGSFRHSLSISGPSATGRCPLPPKPPPRTPATATPTATPTRSPIPIWTATPAPCTWGAVCVVPGTTVASPGERTRIEVGMFPNGDYIVRRLEMDLVVQPSTRVAVRDDGAPACEAGAAHPGWEASFDLEPAGCSPQHDCSGVHVRMLLPGVGLSAILFRCEIDVAADAAFTNYEVRARNLYASEATEGIYEAPVLGGEGDIVVVPPGGSPDLITRTPRATATPTATPTQTATAAARLMVHGASGRPGETVLIRVALDITGGRQLAATQNDLHFDPVLLDFTASNGRPDCRTNPAIDKPGSIAFQPPGCTPGIDCTAIRALVISFADTAPILNGSLLYECRGRIAEGAMPGSYPVTTSYRLGSDPQGNPLELAATDGTVEVLARDPGQISLSSGGAMTMADPQSNSGGCSLSSSPNARGRDGAYLLLAPLLPWWWRRRRQVQRPGDP
jgi:hypothetical protein